MQKKIKLSLICAALASQLAANENITLFPLEVTSTTIKTDELHATKAIEIYTQKDIEESHTKSLYDFLNKKSSITTMPSYGNPFAQQLDMHGYGISNGYQNIVIKIDGRRINNIDMVPQLLSTISPNQVKRIEIIKSSGIIEGGDGANAGVINIITKESNDKKIGFYAGTYNSFDGNFYVGHTDEKLSLSLSGEAQKNGGIRYIDDNNNKDENKFSNFSLNLSYRPLDALQLRANLLTSDIDTWYASSLTEAQYNEDPTQKSNSWYSGVHQKYKSNTIKTGIDYFAKKELSFSADFSHEYKKSNYITYASESKYNYNNYNINAKYNNNNIKIVLGIEGFDGERKGATNTTTKTNSAGYISTEYKLANNSFEVGYRYEKVTYEYSPNAGAYLTQKESLNGVEIGFNHILTEEHSLFANYTKSYQAPDIDRFFNWGGTFNSFIAPMKANNYTIGYNFITKQNRLKLSVYYIDLKDEIYYYSDPSYMASKNTNIDKSHKYGFDLYEKFIVNQKFNIAINYNYVMAKIDTEIENGEDFSNKELPGVSNHNIKAMLNYMPNKKTTLSLTQIYRSEAYSADDFANSFTQKQEAYTSTDISATYSTKSWELFATIENLFNQKNGLWIKDDAIYPVNFTTTAMVGLTLKY